MRNKIQNRKSRIRALRCLVLSTLCAIGATTGAVAQGAERRAYSMPKQLRGKGIEPANEAGRRLRILPGGAKSVSGGLLGEWTDSSEDKSRTPKQTPCTDCVVGTVPCPETVETVQGNLGTSDCALGDNTFIDLWRIEVAQPSEITIFLRSTAFDGYLLLADANCDIVAQNDDCEGLNSCIVAFLGAGTHFIAANSVEPFATGPYSLSVSCRGTDACKDCAVGSVACGETVTGTLPAGNCVIGVGSSIVFWTLEVSVPTDINLTLTSSSFDTFLTLHDNTCEPIASNNDCQGTDSCLSASLQPGIHSIAVKNFDPNESGSYSLRVACGCDGPDAPGEPQPPDRAISVPVNLGMLSWNGFDAPREAQSKVIYGEDDRKDVYEVDNERVRAVADSTVALIERSLLRDEGDGFFELPSKTFDEEVFEATGLHLCDGEPFRDQPNPAFCSGFLVGPDLVATAGHCVGTLSDCSDTVFVFGFNMLDAQTPRLRISANEIYNCLGVVESFATETTDWAIVQLDRAVTGHAPLAVRREGDVDDGQRLLVIGHPMGLPTKVASGARVRDDSHPEFFVSNLDAYAGNSGSPVFNADTFAVEGILVRGENDFMAASECVKSKRCPDDGCAGEQVTRAKEFAQRIPLGAAGERYRVRFGPCGEVADQGETANPTWSLATLSPGTKYCWQIIAINDCGENSAPEWSFTTNHQPAVTDIALSTDEDVPLREKLPGSDADSDRLSYVILKNGTMGTARLLEPSTGEFSYMPNPNENGTDTFVFKISDGFLESDEATVTITVRPVNDAPFVAAMSGLLRVDEGKSLSGTLHATDFDGDSLSFAITRQPQKGKVTLDPESGAFTYETTERATGEDSFAFKASDGMAESNDGVIQVRIKRAGGGGGGGGGCTSSRTSHDSTVLIFLAALFLARIWKSRNFARS